MRLILRWDYASSGLNRMHVAFDLYRPFTRILCLFLKVGRTSSVNRLRRVDQSWVVVAANWAFSFGKLCVLVDWFQIELAEDVLGVLRSLGFDAGRYSISIEISSFAKVGALLLEIVRLASKVSLCVLLKQIVLVAWCNLRIPRWMHIRELWLLFRIARSAEIRIASALSALRISDDLSLCFVKVELCCGEIHVAWQCSLLLVPLLRAAASTACWSDSSLDGIDDFSCLGIDLYKRVIIRQNIAQVDWWLDLCFKVLLNP
jgi:hypothetical protein